MKKLIITFGICLFTLGAFTQDFHLSQYWASPLNLNPALTGLFDDNVRFAANYRNQWFSYSSFTTYAVSADANLWRKKLNGNVLGVGLGFYQDIEGAGEFKNTGVNFALAYNQKISSRKLDHYIGFGIQGAYYHKQINLNNLVYGNLFEINQNIDPINNLNYQSTSLMDFNAGINYFINVKDRHSISAGLAASHIAQPNVSFGNNNEDVLYRKISANFSAKLTLQNDVFSIIPIMLFQKQGPHTEIDFGSYVRFLLNEQNNTALYVGGQYRLSAYDQNNFGSDAFILGLRGEYQNIDIGFSYDVTVSNLRNAKNFMGGPELYVIYTIPTDPKSRQKSMNCPKF